MNQVQVRVVGCCLASLLVLAMAGCPPTPTGPQIIVVDSVAALKAALNALGAGGGRIVVKAGNYALAESIEISKDNVVIEGEGAATYFRLNDNVGEPCFILGAATPAEPAVTHRNIVLKNMRIDGNRANQPSEFSTAAGRTHLRNNCVTIRKCVDTTVENVVVENARSGGVVTEKGCDNIAIRGVTAFNHFFDGIACYVTTRSTIAGCTARDNDGAGLSCDLGFRDSVVSNCFFVDNGTVGVFWRDCTGNLLAHSVLSGNTDDGIFVADGDAPGNLPTSANIFAANFYTDNGRNGFWQAGANSVNNVVDGGIFEGNGEAAIEESFPEAAPLLRSDVTELP